jgi:sugar phosphate isomerase/epimerase
LRPTTRRQFLAQSAATTAGILLAPGLQSIAAASSGPKLQFPSQPRERISIASYPFREVIAGPQEQIDSRSGDKMDLKDFAAHVSSEFHIKKIEPWSQHFRSLDRKYLGQFRAAVEKAQGAVVNIAVDGQHSPYAASQTERDKAVNFGKQWVDVAATIGSPSIRANIPVATDAEIDVDRAADTLSRVAEYGASKNVIINLENDNPLSEDPFFVVKVIEKVNSPWLHALPDFANTLATGREDYAYTGIQAMFGHAYNICHIKEMEADEKGQVFRVDMPKTFGILKSNNYKGYCSIEWDSPGDPYKGTQDLIDKAIHYLS